MSDSENPINKTTDIRQSAETQPAIIAAGNITDANMAAANGNGSQLSLSENAKIFSAIGDITYHWNLASDDISFSQNIQQIAEFIDISTITSAAGFAAVMAADNIDDRYNSVCKSRQSDDGQGVEYKLEYRMVNSNSGNQGCWIEDKGKWFAGASGRPETAFGVMRIIDKSRAEAHEQALYANRDLLTGFVHRVHLCETLKQSVVSIEKQNKQGAFLLIGIDNLAMINQAYGLDVADEVIALVAKRIQSLLRRTDVIGRYAGNKFGIILHNCGLDQISVAAQRLIGAIGEDVIRTGTEAVSVTLSAGGVSIPKHSNVPQDIMQFAEQALTLAKERPVESFFVYQPNNHREISGKVNVTVAGEIVNGLNDRRVKVVYQPLVAAANGEVASYECLIRLETKDGETLTAAQIVPVAERLNLMRLLDLRVLEIALQKLKDVPQLHLAVNISAGTIVDSNWLDYLTASVGGQKSFGHRLTIEITETALLSDVQYTAEFVHKIHKLGCLVAIDNFGAGQTSFQNLKLLNVDIVKIDGSFMQNLRHCDDDKFFVQTMQNMAKHFDLKTVAGWVEHAEDVATLRDIGVDYLQGFYFGQGKAELLKADKHGKLVLGEIYQQKTRKIKNTERQTKLKIG
ncbi:MAG: bifunctional diguanylate cyclase/phosphodiesterase [Rhizobiales bacterium]|nr:bifunctional diguanylate cyclase/phosphodiesterase [Hyphomicrobiales bacterium]NRB14701.1 bifunctional diguanylate cyclase/phosphodiesterase [Hyphomicrobiales bacterium]